MSRRCSPWIWPFAFSLVAWIGTAAFAAPSLSDDDEDTLLPASPASSATDSADESDSNSDASDDDQSGDSPEVELIQERYPNRNIKLEREVTQDPRGNYVNHGFYKLYDERGTLMAEGQYQNGERHGLWNRWFRGKEVDLFSKSPYNQFTGPFVSQATFVDGKLSGPWVIFDSKQHKIVQWEFAEGRRNGKSTWYYGSGKPMREIDYKDGEIDGQLLEWNADGNLITKDTYQEGRKLAMKSDNHTPGHKKSEGTYLFAKEALETPDDWWNMKLATYTKVGKDERHGTWTQWYPTGQKQLEGEFQNDAQVGKFTWWFANGQKALEGIYERGKQDGKWVWWHQNGQRSVQGNYTMGNPTGRWTWWDETGKVAQSADLSHTEGVVIEMPQPKPGQPTLGQPIPAPMRKQIKR